MEFFVTFRAISRLEYKGGLNGRSTGKALDSPFYDGYFSQMKSASITETKNQLSALLELVKQGQTVIITERDQPIARIEPMGHGGPDGDTLLLALERKGLVRRAKGAPSSAIHTESPARSAASILAALDEERSQGR